MLWNQSRFKSIIQLKTRMSTSRIGETFNLHKCLVLQCLWNAWNESFVFIHFFLFHRAYSIMDSSRVSTFLISILLIVYGSFRSLNMEQEAREREKEKERANLLSGLSSGTGITDSANSGSVQTLDTMHALCLPLGASISLLIMFFFFDSMQMLFAICTASKFNNSPEDLSIR